MRRLLLFFLCCTLLTTNVFATDIIVRPTYVTNPPVKRAPLLLPHIEQNGHTLSFDSSCTNCYIEFVKDGVVVYATIVDECGIVELPNELIGFFELLLERSSVTFVGEIEL